MESHTAKRSGSWMDLVAGVTCLGALPVLIKTVRLFASTDASATEAWSWAIALLVILSIGIASTVVVIRRAKLAGEP